MKAKLVVWALAMLSAASQTSLLGAESSPNVAEMDFSTAKSRADSGDIDGILRLAEMYENGDGVKKDLGKAAKLHRKAAEQGSARAQCLVGLDYADGLGVKVDKSQAMMWLRRSAAQGWASAQFDLGMCYAMGSVPNKSASDAVVWYRKAAEQGLPDAECALGNCYLEGVGLPKDIPDGVMWVRRAAEKGFAPAQQALGICYTKGRGVPKDLVQAYKWLDLAASKDDQNTDDTKVNLSSAERFMTPEQITEAQRLAAEFKAQKVPAPGKAHELMADAGATNSLAAHASPVSATPEPAAGGKTGSVIVKADDESSEVFVDGAFVGNAPARLKLAEGNHLIEVKLAGHKDYRKQIAVGDGAELNLKVVLEKQ